MPEQVYKKKKKLKKKKKKWFFFQKRSPEKLFCMILSDQFILKSIYFENFQSHWQVKMPMWGEEATYSNTYDKSIDFFPFCREGYDNRSRREIEVANFVFHFNNLPTKGTEKRKNKDTKTQVCITLK